MKNPLPEGVETYWANNLWDRNIFEESKLGKEFIEQRDLLIEAIEKYKPSSILILCCGVGVETKQISELNFVKEIVAIDINKESCKRTEELTKDSEKVVVLNQNIYDIDYEKEFDTVICFDALHHLDKQDLILNKIHRALKDKGLFIGNYFGKELFIQWEIRKYGFLKYLIVNGRYHLSTTLLKLNLLPKQFIEYGWIRTFLLRRHELVNLLSEHSFELLSLNSKEWHFFVSRRK